MGISVSGFKRGDIVILAEGVNGVYGKYHVCAKGGSMAVLARCGTDGRFRYVLKRCSGEGERLVGAVSPHVLCESVLWGGVPGYVGDGDLSVPYGKPVDVVRVFPAGARREADKFFEALVRVRELLAATGSVAHEGLTELSGDVERIVSSVESDAVAGLEVILRNCEKLLDGIGFFAVSEWEHLEEFEGKVANEVPGADTEYEHLEGELIGVSPVGLFVGDIVRLGACDGIEYLQVVEVSADRFKMKNLTRGGFDTLAVKGTPFERKNEEGVEWYGYSIVLEGPIVDEYCHNFVVLPTRDPELVGAFDALYSLQGSLISKFGWGIRDSLESFEEAEQSEVAASAGVSPAEARRTFMVGLLREIESLVNKARYSGSTWRLQHLEREVSELIVSRFEEEEKTVRGRIDKLREALETVVEINSQK